MGRRLARECWIVTLATIIGAGFLGCGKQERTTIGTLAPTGGKPTAPVTVSYEVPEQARPGQEAVVVVSVTVDTDAQDVVLRMTTGEGLSIPSGEQTLSYGNRSEGSKVFATATVVPLEDGLHYINVFVSGQFHGRAMTRCVAIPLQVGDTPTAKQIPAGSQLKMDADGKPVIATPLTR